MRSFLVVVVVVVVIVVAVVLSYLHTFSLFTA